MDLDRLKQDWDELGRTDPLWAIMTSPGKQGGRWDPEHFFRTGEREITRVLQHVESLDISLPSREALDFGCGVGRLTQALAARFEHVVGVDIAASMIEQARELNRHGDRCTYILNQAADLAIFPDERFDFVYSNITLQHMPPKLMRRYLAEFLRILDPAGVAVFELTSRPKRVRLLIRSAVSMLTQYAGRRGRMHMYWMRPPKVVSVLESRGGKVLDVRPTFEDAGWVRYRYSVVRAAG